jgi:hypothetical protein
LSGVSLSAALLSSYNKYQKLSQKDAKLKEQGFVNYFSKIYQHAHSSKGIKEHSLPAVGILFSELCFAGSGLYALKQLLKGDEVEKDDNRLENPIVFPEPFALPNPIVPSGSQEKTPEELAAERSLASLQGDEALGGALKGDLWGDEGWRRAQREQLSGQPVIGHNADAGTVVFSPLVEDVFARINGLPHVFDSQFFNAGAEISTQGLCPTRNKEMIISGVAVVVDQLPSLDQHEDHRAKLGVVTAGDLCGYYVVSNAVGLQTGFAVDRQKFNEFLKPAMQQIEKLRNDKNHELANLVMLADEEIAALLKTYVPKVEMYFLPFNMLLTDFNQQAVGSEKVYIVHTDVVGQNGHWIAVSLLKNPQSIYVKVMDSMNIIRTEGDGALDKLT